MFSAKKGFLASGNLNRAKTFCVFEIFLLLVTVSGWEAVVAGAC